ncbi:sulfotransferase family protein [Owenweeksia hongkongensis]|uniref:sulfotransferase family protein n=1 Tax=Owenweeksia hongkongensis TaxID=253245 RepID=UPI003A8D8925
MKTQDRLPDFLIIGAGKSGTTAILYFLGKHPDIFFPKRKEPNFFALKGVDVNSYEFEESKEYHLRSIDNLPDYLELFRDAPEDKIAGENSNQYLYAEQAIPNIKEYVPNAKLIALIRHPAERLVSRYNHMERDSVVPIGGIDAIFDKTSIWWKRPDLLQEGFYGKHLGKYFEAFDREQIKVILYDDFKADNTGVIKDICQFIGVNPDFEVDTEIEINKSGKLKDNFFNKMLGQNGTIINALKKVSPTIHKTLKNNTAVKERLIQWRNKNLETVEFPADFKERVTKEIYIDDIKKLEKILGRSLEHWYTF